MGARNWRLVSIFGCGVGFPGSYSRRRVWGLLLWVVPFQPNSITPSSPTVIFQRLRCTSR